MRQHPPSYSLAPATTKRIPLFRARLLEWFAANKRSFPWREPGRTVYQILVAEILLQRTPAAVVARMYPTLIARYPSWVALSRASFDELCAMVMPLGLGQVRAEILERVAQIMVEHGDDVLATRLDLERIKGIGQYTASAVMAVVYDQPEPLLDVNMARVLERYFGPRTRADIRDDPYLHALARCVVQCEDSLQLSWAILDLGALICKSAQPICPACPLQKTCLIGCHLQTPIKQTRHALTR